MPIAAHDEKICRHLLRLVNKDFAIRLATAIDKFDFDCDAMQGQIVNQTRAGALVASMFADTEDLDLLSFGKKGNGSDNGLG